MVVKLELNVAEQATTNKSKTWTDEERRIMYEIVTCLRRNMTVEDACDKCAEYLGRTSKGVENEYYKYNAKLELIQKISVNISCK